MIINIFFIFYLFFMINTVVQIILNELKKTNIKSSLIICGISKIIINQFVKCDVNIRKGYIFIKDKFYVHYWLLYNNMILDISSHLLFKDYLDIKKLSYYMPLGVDETNYEIEKKETRIYLELLKNKFLESINNEYGYINYKIIEDLFDVLMIKILYNHTE